MSGLSLKTQVNYTSINFIIKECELENRNNTKIQSQSEWEEDDNNLENIQE